MKSNKGFTLIELLAVIVILAIIALIATPTILGVIETARKGSAEQSALGYIDAIEKQVAIDMLEEVEANKVIAIPSTTSGNDIKGVIKLPVDKLVVKGTAPKAGSNSYVKINSETGIISEGCLTIELGSKEYNVKYNGNKAEVPEENAACTLPTA